jgi:hypothetical protein
MACLLAAQVGVVLAVSRIRPLRLAPEAWTEAVMLAGMQSLPPAGLPDSIGMVERYRDGGIVLLTTSGLEDVRIGPDTVIASVRGPDGVAALRPGVAVAVWGRRALLRDAFDARAMLVP